MVLKGLTEQEANTLRKKFGIEVSKDKVNMLLKGKNLNVSKKCSMCGEDKEDVQKIFNGTQLIILCKTCLKSTSEEE